MINIQLIQFILCLKLYTLLKTPYIKPALQTSTQLFIGKIKTDTISKFWHRAASIIIDY